MPQGILGDFSVFLSQCFQEVCVGQGCRGWGRAGSPELEADTHIDSLTNSLLLDRSTVIHRNTHSDRGSQTLRDTNCRCTEPALDSHTQGIGARLSARPAQVEHGLPGKAHSTLEHTRGVLRLGTWQASEGEQGVQGAALGWAVGRRPVVGVGEEAPAEGLGRQEFLFVTPGPHFLWCSPPHSFFAQNFLSSFTFSTFSVFLLPFPFLSFSSLPLPWVFQFPFPLKPLAWVHWKPMVPVCWAAQTALEDLCPPGTWCYSQFPTCH